MLLTFYVRYSGKFKTLTPSARARFIMDYFWIVHEKRSEKRCSNEARSLEESWIAFSLLYLFAIASVE